MVDRVKAREVIFLNSAFFVLGFTFVFSMVGVLLQTVLSKASLEAVNTVRLIGGSVILAFRPLIIASAKYAITFFRVAHKIHRRKIKNSYVTSPLFSLSF